MFGSKHLLIAFVIGATGLCFMAPSIPKVGVLFSVGILLIWVSALFGGFLASLEMSGHLHDNKKDDQKTKP